MCVSDGQTSSKDAAPGDGAAAAALKAELVFKRAESMFNQCNISGNVHRTELNCVFTDLQQICISCLITVLILLYSVTGLCGSLAEWL